MQFGQTDNLDSIDFRLPPDHAKNAKILSSKRGAIKTKVYVGCAKWDRPDWIGKVYPPDAKKKDFQAHYLKQFNSMEVNSTFYHIFAPSVMQRWKEMAPEGFLYCPKFNNSITHIKRLKNAEKQTEDFLASIYELGDKLGPCFLQLHENFGPKNMQVVLDYLDTLPKNLDLFLEFRHKDWFAESAELEDFYDQIAKRKKGMVITDAAGRRDCLHMRLTVPKTFIRFVGNSLHPTDYKRIDYWMERLGDWMEHGLEELYYFMHMHDELYSPELVHYLITNLNKTYKLELEVPKMYTGEEAPAKKPVEKEKAQVKKAKSKS